MNETSGWSVFLGAIGPDVERVHPAVLAYLKGPPAPGQALVLEGTFAVAGSRFRRLNLLARPVVGPRLFVTAYERDVPFRVTSRESSGPLGSGPIALNTERQFMFREGTQLFDDVLMAGAEPGTLRNLLGAAKRVEVALRCRVSEAGSLVLVSERAWLRVGSRLRLRLPALLSVQARLENGFNAQTGRLTIGARVRHPLLGTVLEYRGEFQHHAA